MAELTNLEDKLGEVIGLAMAAQSATAKITKLTDDEELASVLDRMSSEAADAEERGTQLASSFEGKKTAILDKARETKSKALPSRLVAVLPGSRSPPCSTRMKPA